jgi:hypothetical protein
MLGEAGEEEEIEGTGVPSPLSISWLPLLVAPSGSIAPGLVARVGSLPLRSNRGRPGMGPRCRDGETCSLPACEIYEFQRMSPAKSRPGVLMSGLAGQSRGSQPPAQPWRCKGRPLLLAQCQMDPSRILQTRAPLSNLDSGNLGAAANNAVGLRAVAPRHSAGGLRTHTEPSPGETARVFESQIPRRRMLSCPP